MIKFIRESEIPEFSGKTWREKGALRRLAIQKNKSIYWITIISGACFGVSIALFFLAAELLSLKYLHRNINLISYLILLFAISIPSSYLFERVIINPKIKKYFEDKKGNPN